MKWKNDDELIRIIREELFSAVVADIMDQMGFLHQFLPPRIQPLRDDMMVACRAMPVPEADAFCGGSGLDTLFITSARIGLSDEDLGFYPHSGGLFAIKPGVKGLKTTFFKGKYDNKTTMNI